MNVADLADVPYLLMAQNTDPDFAFHYRSRARRWWQIWKPRWKVAYCPSQNQRRQKRGLPDLPPSYVRVSFS